MLLDAQRDQLGRREVQTIQTCFHQYFHLRRMKTPQSLPFSMTATTILLEPSDLIRQRSTSFDLLNFTKTWPTT